MFFYPDFLSSEKNKFVGLFSIFTERYLSARLMYNDFDRHSKTDQMTSKQNIMINDRIMNLRCYLEINASHFQNNEFLQRLGLEHLPSVT